MKTVGSCLSTVILAVVAWVALVPMAASYLPSSISPPARTSTSQLFPRATLVGPLHFVQPDQTMSDQQHSDMQKRSAGRLLTLSRHLLIASEDATGQQHNQQVPQLQLKLSAEVQHALQNNQPVVALESTIISHGMPYPQNLQTALEVEQVVRQHGATPATIAIIAGQPCIGCDRQQLEHIARKGLAVRKVSRRDMPLVIGSGLDGATTVSGTMLLAARAGIKVFVTGGIGGVHRGGEVSMDISADLTELGRTPVAVVCAGAKSVLDIPRTLEYLETQGVCVAAYGADEFPAFFSRHSGCKAPCRVDTPEQAARMIRASHQLQLDTGMLLAVPIPAAAAAGGAAIQQAIQESLREADEKGVAGAEVTPFLLESIRNKTGGKSLVANIQLVKNNAAVGSQIAVALSALGS